jgi:hypothetical protein
MDERKASRLVKKLVSIYRSRFGVAQEACELGAGANADS